MAGFALWGNKKRSTFDRRAFVWVDPYPAIARKEKEDLNWVTTPARSSSFAFLAGLIALCREGQAENGREADYEIADD